jgi:hypothetical protein
VYLQLCTTDVIKAIATVVRKDKYVVIASFKSNFNEFDMPLTTTNVNSKGQASLVIDGQMTLIATITGTSPAMGHVTGRVPVSLIQTAPASADSSEARLAPLLDYEPDLNTPPLKLLIIGENGTKSCADGYCFGPLPDGQVDNCVQMLQYLVKTPFLTITDTEARMLLQDKNPLKVYLGIARLTWGGTHTATPKDYFTALKSLPVEGVANMTADMSSEFSDWVSVSEASRIRAALTNDVLAFLKDAEAPRQQVVVKRLNELLKNGSWGVDRWLQPDKQVIAGIRALIEERQDKAEWQGVVAEYRKMLTLLEKKAYSGSKQSSTAPWRAK